MAILWDDVLSVAPELLSFDAGAQEDILNYVNNTFKESEWSDSYMLRLAQIYLAAHMATVSSQSGDGVLGSVVRERVGELEREYGRSSLVGTDALFDSTTYGLQFRALLRRSPARAPFVV